MQSAESVGVLVAFSAGMLSFLSPCVLPLVPSYASFITGMSLDALRGDAQARERSGGRRAVWGHGVAFVLGFSLVFIALGASATLLGAIVKVYDVWLSRIGGLILIALGLYLLGLLRIPGAEREFRVHLANKPAGYVGTALVGVAFGAGWTPCIGPVLGGILTLAATRDSVAQGMGLLTAYSAGLAIPFLIATVALDRFLGAFATMRRWLPWIQRISGVLLIAIGVLLLMGSLTMLSAYFARFTPDFILKRL